MRRIFAFLIMASLPLALSAQTGPATKAAPKAAPRPAAKPAPKPAPKRAAAPANWTTTVRTSAIGGHVMGNPAARYQLIEYISYTCPHCADYTMEATAPLKQGWVRGGLLNVEVRNAVRDSFDLTAALLARCGGPTKFFGNHAALFANHGNWMTQMRNYDAIAHTMEGKSQVEIMTAVADKSGLFALMQKRGFTRPQLNACLADKASLARVLAMTDEAWKQVEIGGTPGFTLNGVLLRNIHDWNGVKAILPPAAP